MHLSSPLAIAAVAVVRSACGSSPSDPEATSSLPPLPEDGSYVVTFADLLVSPGQVVTVTNADDEPHTVTATDGGFDTGSFDKAGPAEFTAPLRIGTYDFLCRVHPSMQGTLTVR